MNPMQVRLKIQLINILTILLLFAVTKLNLPEIIWNNDNSGQLYT